MENFGQNQEKPSVLNIGPGLDSRDAKEVIIHKQETEDRSQSRCLGILGKLFGNAEHAKTNTASLVIFILLFFCIAISSSLLLADPKDNEGPWKVWTVIIPLITLFTGYFFGKRA